MQKNFSIIFAALFLLNSCADKDKDYDKSKAISAFANNEILSVDKKLEKINITIPRQQENKSWGGSAALRNQEVENFTKTFDKEKKFFGKSEKISLSVLDTYWSGYKPSYDGRFVFSPAIGDGKIFLLNVSGKLTARDLTTKKEIWKSRIFPKEFLKNYQNPKIFFSKGKIFAIAGTNRIIAASATDGKIIWSKDISSIPISTPVSDGNLVYVSTNDNKTYAFKEAGGELVFVHSGIVKQTAIFGAADPVIYKNSLLISYSSGEIYCLNKSTGAEIWSQNLNLNKAVTSDFYLNDIDATPIVKKDVVYAIGNGGLMIAADAKTGNILWKKEVAGLSDFWFAGDFLFVINNDNKLLSIHAKTGGIKWISQLPYLAKKNKPETKIIYNSVIMAGDKLLILDTNGEILIASPFNGEIEKTIKVGKEIYNSLAIVENVIYVHSLQRFTSSLIEIK